MTEFLIATGESLVRLTPDGENWESNQLLGPIGVQCLAIESGAHPAIYAGTRGRGVWKSLDDGVTWDDLRLPEKDVFSMAVSAADSAVYAGTEPSRIFCSRNGGESWEELESLQSIPSRPTWSFPPRPWTSHVRSIAPSPHRANVILAGIELGGLMYTEDGGETWLDHRPGAQRDVHALAWHPREERRAYEAGGGGAAWSHDGGRSWEPADAGRDRHYTYALAVDPEDPDCWFVSASPGPGNAHSGGDAQAFIYRWRARGPWEALSGGLAQPLDQFPYALAISTNYLIAGLGDGRLYASQNRGDSWKLLNTAGDPIGGVSAILIRE